MFYCWITAMFASYQDDVIAGLANKGYMVGPIDINGKVIHDTDPYSASIVMGIKVYRDQPIVIDDLYDDLISILTQIKAKFYSVIISEAAMATWSSANFTFPPTNETKRTPSPDTNLN